MSEPTIDEMIDWLESTDSFQERSDERRKAIRAILEREKNRQGKNWWETEEIWLRVYPFPPQTEVDAAWARAAARSLDDYYKKAVDKDTQS